MCSYCMLIERSWPWLQANLAHLRHLRGSGGRGHSAIPAGVAAAPPAPGLCRPVCPGLTIQPHLQSSSGRTQRSMPPRASTSFRMAARETLWRMCTTRYGMSMLNTGAWLQCCSAPGLLQPREASTFSGASADCVSLVLMKVVAVLTLAKKRRLQRNNSAPLSPHGTQQYAEEAAALQKSEPEPQRTVTFGSLPTPSPAAAASASVLHGQDVSRAASPTDAGHSAASMESLNQLRQADSITSQCSATSAGCAQKLFTSGLCHDNHACEHWQSTAAMLRSWLLQIGTDRQLLQHSQPAAAAAS
jgi:hypothetical protein